MNHLNRIFPDPPRDKTKLWLDRNECNCIETKKLIKSIHDNVNTCVLSTYPSLDPVYEKLSNKLEVEKNFISLTCGADGAIKQFFEHNRGCTALLMRPSFMMNEVYAHYYCDNIIYIDYNNLKVDLRSIRVGISKLSKGDIFILASPDSPVGVQYTQEDLLYIADLCRFQQVKILFDETYILFGDRHSMLPHVDDTISVCTSFSKSIGLAGVRLGYLVCSDISIKDNKPMKDIGKPTIKQAKESKENIDLKDDPEKTMAGMGKLDYTLVSNKEVKEAIDELIGELEFVGYDDFERNGVNYASPEQFNQLMETTAQFYSNEDRIQHAKKMQERLQ
mgnify:CR=1 FL=1